MVRVYFVATVPETFFYFLNETVLALRSAGHHVTLIASPGSWINSKDVIHKYQVRYQVVPLNRNCSVFADIRAWFALYKIFRKGRPDIIHASTPKASALSMSAAWAARVPYRIYSVRGLIAYGKHGLAKRILHFIEKLTCRLAHKVILNSESNREYFLRGDLCKPEKMGILGYGSGQGVDAEGKFNPVNVRPEEVEALRVRYGILQETVVFGFVGRLVKDKGVGELAEVWRGFVRDYPEARLIIIGPEKEPRDVLNQETLRYLATEKSVILTGAVKNPVAYYALMDVLVHPSKREGFPNAVLEAGAMAKPVITTDAPGCIDSILDGITGMHYPVLNNERLRHCMETLYKSPALRISMGDAARKHVLQYYRPEVIAEDLLYLYEHRRFRERTGGVF